MVETPPIVYYEQERADFASGSLCREWRARYPQLFDELDLKRALTQPRRHFREWRAAIELFKNTGCKCLYEKYQFRKAHPRKFEIFEQLVPPRVRALLPPTGRPQGPDLFMYSDATAEWFFAEAKRSGEPLTKSQRQLFPALERRSGWPIRVVRFIELKGRRAG